MITHFISEIHMARQYEDTETRRRQVAEAALRTIAEDGASNFTTRAIAGRVGISDGTLFRHFGSKKEIVLEAMGLLEVEILSSLISKGDALLDVEAFFRYRAAFVGAEGSVGRLIFSDGLNHLAGDEGRVVIERWRSVSLQYLLQRLSKLKESGRFADNVDVPTVSMLIQGSLLTFAMQASLGRGGTSATLHAQIDHAWASLRNLLFV
ncbi:MAG: TetR/AcrR family transcriptional regulator [Kiritimatiellia bacterium]